MRVNDKKLNCKSAWGQGKTMLPISKQQQHRHSTMSPEACRQINCGNKRSVSFEIDAIGALWCWLTSCTVACLTDLTEWLLVSTKLVSELGKKKGCTCAPSKKEELYVANMVDLTYVCINTFHNFSVFVLHHK